MVDHSQSTWVKNESCFPPYAHLMLSPLPLPIGHPLSVKTPLFESGCRHRIVFILPSLLGIFTAFRVFF